MLNVAPAPHARAPRTVTVVMGWVLLALLPAAAVHLWLFGPGLIVNLFIATVTALLAEALCLRARGRAVAPALNDLSAVLCAALLAFCLPPLTPWWVTITAAAFAIIVGKQAYGGLGRNLFNPAMVGYAVVLVSFPEAMTRWPSPGGDTLSLMQSLSAIATGTPGDLGWDAVTMATPLDQLRVELGRMRMLSEIMSAGLAGRQGWWLFQAAVLLGGLGLMWLKIIRWQLPVALLGGVIVTATVLRIVDADAYASAAFHLGAGSAMLAAFFIVTDPVTAATSPRGRLIFGFATGVLAILIRTYGAYPDGMAFAVLLMNATVPLIDRWTVPRTFGHVKPRDEDTLT